MRKMLAALITAAATVGMLTGAGAASAATGHPASSNRAVTGTEYFQLVGTSLSGNRNKVVAYGVFNASGIDHEISNTKDIFTFPGGSFLVTHKVTHMKQHFNRRTCAATVFERGVYQLSRGHGKYAGISGHGRFTVYVLVVTRHTSTGCSRRPIAAHTLIQAHGPVSLS